MLFESEHPELALRDCQFCMKVLHNAEGKPEERRGSTPELPIYYERDSTCPPDCQTEKGCPKGTPENPRTLTTENRRCVEHYRECVAVGQFPDDDVVRRNAALIRAVDELVERKRQMNYQNETRLLFLYGRSGK